MDHDHMRAQLRCSLAWVPASVLVLPGIHKQYRTHRPILLSRASLSSPIVQSSVSMSPAAPNVSGCSRPSRTVRHSKMER